MRRFAWYIFALFLVVVLVGLRNLSQVTLQKIHAQETVSSLPSVSSSPSQSQINQQGNINDSSLQVPTPTRTNPFVYTPLPTNRGGPGNDIIESSPLTASRTTAQVDDSITFSVTIKNVAPYHKHLWNICFESTDGNMGCIFTVDLDPGQTFTLQNVGTWVHGGTKQVWVTWSQDDINYYTPLHANTVTVHIVG